jgi:hypothetical protein
MDVLVNGRGTNGRYLWHFRPCFVGGSGGESASPLGVECEVLNKTPDTAEHTPNCTFMLCIFCVNIVFILCICCVNCCVRTIHAILTQYLRNI